MFTNMKLATKIGLGFAALIVIACALGGLAVFNMKQTGDIAQVLATQNVPEVSVANEVERSSLLTMYTTRGYAYTEETAFLDEAVKNMADVKTHIREAQTLANRYDISLLRKNADKAEVQALQYEKLMNETVAAIKAMEREKAASLEAADRYMKICYDFMESQSKELRQKMGVLVGTNEVLATAAGVISNQIKKIEVTNEIIDLGNWIRIGTWQSIATRNPDLFKSTEKKFDEVNQHLDELKAMTQADEERRQIEECRAAGKAYLQAMESFLVNWFAREEINQKRQTTGEAVLEAAKETSVTGMAETVKASHHVAQSMEKASWTMIAGLVVGVLIGLIMAVAITRSITVPINRVINSMSGGAEQVASASNQVSSASQQMAQGSSEQASSLEETSASLEEMASMTRQNADNAVKTNELMAETKEMVMDGVNHMQNMSATISEIRQSAQEMAKIIKTIDEIAFQTNLLALNAAVEAARAGEAGKGFAVVAEEVRNLARRSAEAAKTTASLIEGAQKNAETGVQATAKVSGSLNSIQTGALKVAGLVAEISAASRQQAQGIDQVNLAVGEMDKVIQQNAANAEESASAAEELSGQAQELYALVTELTALVGGAAAIKPRNLDHKRPPRSTPPAGLHTHVTASAAHRPVGTTAPRPLSPEKVIPLEDHELKQF